MVTGRDAIRRRAWVMLSLLALLTPGAAQEEKKDERPVKEAPAKLPQERPPGQREVVVTATRTEENAAEIPQSTTTATSDEIRKRQPSQPIDTLREEPGVSIQKTGASGGTPIIRGMMGNQVLYLIDGIRINNARTPTGPNATFNQVDVGSLQQVEILKGPGSVQHGSDALGGVINQRTKILRLFPEKAEFGGLLSAHYSTVDAGKFAHGEVYAAQDPVNIFIGGTFAGIGNFRGGDDQGTLEHTSYSAQGAMAKTQLKLAAGHVVTAAYLDDIRTDVERYDQSARNQPSGIPRFFTPREERRLTYVRDELEVGLDWIARIEPYVYAQEFMNRSVTTGETGTQIQQDKAVGNQNVYGGGVQFVTELSKVFRLIYGTDVRSEHLHSDSTRFTTVKATGVTTPSKVAGQTPDGTYDVVDGYAMADWRPSDHARIVVGLRYEASHLESDPRPNDASAGFTVDDLDLDKWYSALTYSIGGTYWLLDELALAVNVATGFRAPNYSDTLSFGPSTFSVSIPSPDVKPERALMYEIGPRLLTEDFAAQVVWFQTFLQDVLVSQPTGGFVDLNGNGTQDAGEQAAQRKNSGRGWIRGIEFGATWRFWNGLSIFGNGAWTVGRDETANQPLRFIPPMNGLLGLGYTPESKAITVEFFARMARKHTQVSSSDLTDPARASEPANTFPSATNPPLRSDFRIPGYTTYHLRLIVPLTERATLFLSGDNLSNKQYREAYSRLDSPGMGFTIGAEARF